MLIDEEHPLVLGSGSPRRREMIGWLGVPMVVVSADVDETRRKGESPFAYLERVVKDKLAAVRLRDLGSACAVLVADTIVVAPDFAVLGKPKDDAEGAAMILRLGGATHEVSTRFALAEAAPGAPIAAAHTVTTKVTFRDVGLDEARAYAATGEGRDKAGGYAAQGRAMAFISSIEGSFANVVGLPLSEVVVAMRKLRWI